MARFIQFFLVIAVVVAGMAVAEFYWATGKTHPLLRLAIRIANLDSWQNFKMATLVKDGRLPKLAERVALLESERSRVSVLEAEVSDLAGLESRIRSLEKQGKTRNQTLLADLAQQATALEQEKSRLSALAKDLKRLPALEQQVAALAERLTPLTQQLPDLTQRVEQLAAAGGNVRIVGGAVLATKGDKAWKLADIFSRLRQLRRRIVFANPFVGPPTVMLSITLIDLTQEKVWFQIRAEAIDAQGFTLVLETRSDARVEEARIDWLAFHQDR